MVHWQLQLVSSLNIAGAHHSLKGLARLFVESGVQGLCLLVPSDAAGDTASEI